MPRSAHTDAVGNMVRLFCLPNAVKHFRSPRIFVGVSLILAWLIAVSGCVRVPSTGTTSLKPRSLSELQEYLLSRKPDLDLFRLRGPFSVTVQEDRDVSLPNGEQFRMDVYLSSPQESMPLVILLHGNGNSNKDHAYQAWHLASWGIPCVALQLPNYGPWSANGSSVAALVKFIHRNPQVIDNRIDGQKIVLAGHSFGGFAVAVAMAEGAPVAGGILLDPAAAEDNLPAIMRQISAPVLVVGADERLTSTVNREYFFNHIRRNSGEISVRNAIHEDAQYPGKSFRFDAFNREDQQITFASALTSGAFSLSATGKLDYAWSSFDEAIKKNRFFNARRK